MNIVITHTSSPTFFGTLYSLRQAFDCTLIAISKEASFDQYLVDKYYVYNGTDDYLEFVLSVCKKEKAMCILPHINRDRILFMEHKHLFDALGVTIMSSSAASIKATDSKVSFLEGCKKLGIPVPEYYVVTEYKELKRYAKILGYPEKKIVVKPVAASGSKGFRILNENCGHTVFDKHRADHPETTLSHLHALIGEKFSPLMVCEFLCGDEYTLDCLRLKNQELYMVRKRIETRNGLTTIGQVVENKELEAYAKKLAKHYDLTTVFGFQFMDDGNGHFKVLECNPRIQGTTIMTTLAGANIIAACVASLCSLKPIPLSIEKDMMFYRMYSGIGVGKELTFINFDKKKKNKIKKVLLS
jgi:carbamoyl-phosphate synthase large subunit